MGSPVTPSAFKASLADPTSSVCGNLISTLLKMPVLLYQILNWMFNADGSVSDAFLSSGSNLPGDLIYSAAPLATNTNRLLCNGTTVSRTQYAALFAAIGTVYGAGDGSTTFALPNAGGRFPVGAIQGDSTYGLGLTGGEATHLLTVSELPAHHHTMAGGQGVTSQGTSANITNYGPNDASHTSGPDNTADTGGGTAHNNLPPFGAVFIYIYTGPHT